MPTLEPKPTEDREYDVLPPQTVFALFDSAEYAERAVGRLMKAGVASNHVEVLSGEEGVRRLEPDGARASGVKGFISAVMQEVTDETTLLETYRQEMRLGKSLVAVRFEAEDKEKAKEQRAMITAVLLDSGGSNMSYTSNWTLTKIVERSRTV